MNGIRRISRIILLSLWSLLFFPAVTLDCLFRKKWSAVCRAAKWTQLWAAGCAFLIGMKIRVHGDPGRAAGKLVVSSHTGPLDVPAEGALFPVRFAPQAEMRHWPVFGALTALSRPVWVDRRRRTLSGETADEIAGTLRHGLSMLVYPEGTSSDGRHGLLPFKSTAFESALRTGASLLPVLIFHRAAGDPAFNPAWCGNTAFLSLAWRILGLKGIYSCVYIMPELSPAPGETRKELAERTHRVMSGYYEKCLADFAAGETCGA
ncbi:MAG: 1-acyl-sn-glycerol-3-phosphate acyltransferase [Lentisphaeria bacterium]|nr:1-acyl-sn-glycerol-3-phosphate acyltransferase [Lentisphaeria bacterium]